MTIIRVGNSFKGFVMFEGRRHCFEINMLDQPFKNQAIFKLDWKLKKILGDNLSNFLENNEFVDPMQFYNQFSAFIKDNEKKKKPDSWLANPLKMCSMMKSLKDEIQNVGRFITNLDIETGVVEVEVTDMQMRNHRAVVKLSQNYPREPIKIVYHDLPLQRIDFVENSFDLDTFFTVSQFCKKFSQLVNDFQEFWNIVAVIDDQCWVLDPSNPSFKDTQRRIKITDTLSIVLTFNPMSPKQRPNMKLLGCQSDVNQYRSILQKNLQDDVWDYDEDLIYNLSNVLEVTFPNKTFPEDVDIMELNEPQECAICFVWRLNEEIPNEVCERETCKSLYHTTCLFTYFSSLPRNRDYFGKIQGECPNCSHVMSCSLPKFKK